MQTRIILQLFVLFAFADAAAAQVFAFADAAEAQVFVFDGQALDERRNRTVDYRIYFPETIDGLVPLILVSHGGSGSFSGYTGAEHLGTTFAIEGYVAIHVGHRPSSSGTAHLVDRPGDISFLLNRLGEASLDLPGKLEEHIDLERVGHVGHSYGAYTSHALAGARLELPAISVDPVSFRDERIDAVVLLSPQGADQFGFFDRGPSENSWSDITVPVYSIIGGDELNGNAAGSLIRDGWRLEPFARYRFDGDKYLSIIPGQDHSDLWSSGSPEVEAFIAKNAAHFFDLSLRERPIESTTVGESPRLTGVVRSQKSVDMNGDGQRDFFDILAFLAAFDDGDSEAEATGDTPPSLDGADIEAFLVATENGQSPISRSDEWSISFQAPEVDDGGNRLTGTEIMSLVTHGGLLFAGNSYWAETTELRQGQVFRLDARGGRWQLDLQMPPKYSRVASIRPVVFESDWLGNPMNKTELLIAGATFDKGAFRPGPAGVFVRQPAGQWVRFDLGVTKHRFSYTQIRSIGAWTDRVTGVDLVLLGANPAPLGIFSGAYDESVPGRVRWRELPEYTPEGFQRIMGFAACGEFLYAATQRSILRRIDGPQPRWEVILDLASIPELDPYRDSIDPRWVNEDDIRSFRPDPVSSEPTLLFSYLNHAWRYRPETDSTPTPEQDLAALFRLTTGRDAHYVQAQDATLVAQNGGRTEEWIGSEFFYLPDYLDLNPGVPAWESGFGKDAWYFRRVDQDGQVQWSVGRLAVEGRNERSAPLARVRDFELSPFKGEPAIFAGGFASWFIDVSNTGWITTTTLDPE